MCTSTGEERVYELTSTPVKDSSGKVTSAVVIGRDVTETTILEKQLRHSQKMEAIGTLAGGIAHDFNNVLTPIMGYSEILRFKLMQGGEGEKANLEFVEGILKAAKRAKNLVEQILTFSRSSEQKASLQYIHPIVKEVMKLMRVTLPSTITIQEQIDEQCGIVSVDPVQIHQILINLCTNSAHAMAGGHGTLSVTLASGGRDQNGKEWLRLSIADTGCGIKPELLDRIFEPYFTTKEKSRGTGMGLAMVHGIISRQGGRIEVSSEVGVGTTFDVYLPITVAPTRIDQVVSTSDLQRGSGRILLVDDEAQVVQVTGELLTSLGYEVTGRTSPVVALSLVAANPEGYDLVLTDLTMPELTGVELSRKIQQVRGDLPVVLFTGYSDSVSREDAEAAGIRRYCMKPVSLRELAKVIHTTLQQKG
jgi:signal transduction histidine kinase/ActR/RegA family two-component response regulator